MRYKFSILVSLCFFIVGCKQFKEQINKKEGKQEELIISIPKGIQTPKGMIWIPGGSFEQGAIEGDIFAMNHEKPRHKVKINGFFIDKTEVTNNQFSKFVKETGYKTVAERSIDWDEMKKQLPDDTAKLPDSLLKPGSLTFLHAKNSIENLSDFTQWWRWTIGANWKHPHGPTSSIEDLGNHPVVHIAFEDAIMYCEWAGRRLPTEAEWEYAAKGGTTDEVYYWGSSVTELSSLANTWTGEFPNINNLEDGYLHAAPVRSYPANGYGLYDMAGNVWEWTSDWYNSKYYKELASNSFYAFNPKGANIAYNQNNLLAKEKIIKGGSFLCNASYCASYRISSRMGATSDSSTEHIGFRTVLDVVILAKSEDLKFGK